VSLKLAEQVQEFAWGKFSRTMRLTFIREESIHHGHWKDVPNVWRELYSYSSLLKSFCEISFNKHEDALKTLDLALLMGAPTIQTTIDTLISHISGICTLDKFHRFG
jgi:hypothetical protein